MLGFQLDVQDPTAIDAFADRVRTKIPELNVLLNNAGISRPESLTAETDLSIPRDIIETNIISVLHLMAVLLPTLKAKPHASIITTTSGLAFVPRNDVPTYCAGEAFLYSWLQSLRVELRGSSVEVLELAPPYVQTELSGPHQLSDPRAIPLAAYIDEVMQLLSADAEFARLKDRSRSCMSPRICHGGIAQSSSATPRALTLLSIHLLPRRPSDASVVVDGPTQCQRSLFGRTGILASRNQLEPADMLLQ